MKRWRQHILLFFLLVSNAALTSTANTLPPLNEQRINIPLNRWTSQRVLSHVVGKIISDAGTPVTYLNISSDEQWGAMQRGLVHFQIEIWQPSMEKDFTAHVASGNIIDMGTHDARVAEEWWYPKYVENYCPELPNWRTLNKCSHLFKGTFESSKGIYYGGPWYYSDASIIRALNLEYTIERKNDAMSLWDELKAAIEHHRPILLLNWSPNWTDIDEIGKFIEFPAYEPDCPTKPEWGLNPTLVDDCGNMRNGWLKKAAAPSLVASFPCVYKLIERVNFTHEMVAYAAYLVVAEEHSEENAAAVFSKKYAKEIASWVPSDCELSS
ncbi:ABC transporter substrate-binding protein [Thalassotalea fusca]